LQKKLVSRTLFLQSAQPKFSLFFLLYKPETAYVDTGKQIAPAECCPNASTFWSRRAVKGQP
jgi:hypothetical protein